MLAFHPGGRHSAGRVVGRGSSIAHQSVELGCRPCLETLPDSRRLFDASAGLSRVRTEEAELTSRSRRGNTLW